MSFESAGSGHPLLKRRLLIFSLAVAGIFLLLAMRLWHLQIINHDRYLRLSEKNRIRYLPVAAPRGPIYDREGNLLVDNRPAFTVSVLRYEVADREQLLGRLASLLQADPAELRRRWEAGRGFPPFRPVPLAEDVGRTAMERILENSLELPGVLVEVRPTRSYPRGTAAAHLFGYLGEVTPEELRKPQFTGYRPGELVGKTGLERELEELLRGTEGERRVEVDVQGKELRQLRTQEARPGNRVFLTLRSDLLEAADQAFGDRAGAAVVLSVTTGEILAMISNPGFDPGLFARGITAEEWLALLEDPRHPLENKAIKGQYPPGSTYKPVVALAALRSGVATPATTVTCTGSFELGNREFRCWKEEGHGPTDLRKALKESCDVWFYRVGLETGIDRIAAASRQLGLGSRLGFPLEGEKGGLIPDRDWKRRRFGESWYDGETLIASIGQGFVLTTPLQLAAMTAAIANDGLVLRPYLVDRVETWEGEVLRRTEPERLEETLFSQGQLKPVREALEAVVNEPGGTAFLSRLQGIRYAGKTGTAQVVKLLEDDERELEEIPYRFRDHALFIALAPAENPEVAVSVVVEHGGHGSSAAAPVAKAILARYFGLDEPVARVPEGEGD